MATLAKLKDTAIRAAKGREKPYKMADGGGLHILVKPHGTRYWRYNYRHAGKDRTMALGVYRRLGLRSYDCGATACGTGAIWTGTASPTFVVSRSKVAASECPKHSKNMMSFNICSGPVD